MALLTDFGTRDPYVAALKGVVLSLCREATLVDIVHDLEPHDLLAAALCLESVFDRFPPETAFVVVVDPGVGSARRALAARAGGRFLIGPDNGVFSLVLAAAPDAELHEIRNLRLLPGPVSATFHGRDVFAPVAALLVSGLGLEEVGPLLDDPVVLSLPQPSRLGPSLWEAEILAVDRFGNLITNLSTRELAAVQDEPGRWAVVLEQGPALPLVTTYADVARGDSCALVGSGGRLEIAVNAGSAAARLGVGRGTRIRVVRRRSDGVEGGVL